MVDDVVLPPEVVVAAVPHRFDQPVLILRSQLERRGAAAQRQVDQVVAAMLLHVLERWRQWPGRAIGGCPCGRGVTVDPIPEAQLERAAVAHAGIAQVGHRVDRNRRDQLRRPLHGDRVLRAADVRSANRAHLAVGPGLRGDPGADVHAVATIVVEHVPDAFRAISPPGVLHDECIAVRGKVLAVGLAAILAVRRPHQDRRPIALERLALSRRQVNVGRQPHAVAHAHHDVLLRRDAKEVVGRG